MSDQGSQPALAGVSRGVVAQNHISSQFNEILQGTIMQQYSQAESLRSGLDELEIRLQGQLSGRIRNLQVRLQGCGIVLRGFARTYHAKQLAQHAVMRETQLPIVANEIEVC